MKIDFNQGLSRLDGSPLEMVTETCPTCGRPREATVATLRGICTNALVAQFQDERNLSGEDKVKRYDLALKITNEDVLDLPHDDLALIQKLVAKMYGPLFVGQVWAMLDPKEEDE